MAGFEPFSHRLRNVSDKVDMIRLTRISHAPVVLNSDLIEHIESTPDTVISLTTGQKVVVLESTDEVVRRVIEFRRAVLSSLPAESIAAALFSEGAAHAEAARRQIEDARRQGDQE